MVSAIPATSPRVPDPSSIRDAASVILVRRDGARRQVLMGRRGAAAAFMPDMFVFPGGAVDAADLALSRRLPMPPDELARGLAVEAPPDVAGALPYAAIRELWEETGLRLGRVDGDAPSLAEAGGDAWRGFLAAGLLPRTEALRFVFRAVTPPGRPRRFDARFFMADADSVRGDPGDFSSADAELGQLQWIDLAAARRLPVPFITGVVIAEVEAALTEGAAQVRCAPYFRHDERGSHFRMIRWGESDREA